MGRRTVRALTEHGLNIRVSLGKPAWTGKAKTDGTGVWLTGLWFGRRRIVAEFDSHWYEEVSDAHSIINLCGMAGIELPSFVVPVEDDCEKELK
jgi:hypothetical protein